MAAFYSYPPLPARKNWTGDFGTAGKVQNGKKLTRGLVLVCPLMRFDLLFKGVQGGCAGGGFQLDSGVGYLELLLQQPVQPGKHERALADAHL